MIDALLWTLTRDLAMMDDALDASFTNFKLAHFCGFWSHFVVKNYILNTLRFLHPHSPNDQALALK